MAVEYYDSISKTTGNRFREKLDNRLNLILNSPEAFATIHKSIRAVRIRSYPYVILYEVQPNHVYFLGLVHGAGKRQNWFERIYKPK